MKVGRGAAFWLKIFGIVCGAGLVVGAIAAFAVYRVLAAGLPDMDTLDDYQPNLVTEVYDRHGTLLGEFMYENQRRYLVRVEDLPEPVIRAFLSAEDRSFFEHQGLDYRGMMRAAWANLTSGELKQGGSTITQQVVKSLLLTPEKTFTRKLREAILAQRIEKRLSKPQILYIYLNQVYFGEGAYGVQAAAREFFGVDAAKLNVAQAALLAGLLQAPSRYDPRKNAERALERRHYVLARMLEDGRLTQEEYDQADAAPLGVVAHRELNLQWAPDFVEYVRRYLMKVYGADTVLKRGLRVRTTCDLKLQRAAREAVDLGLRQHAKRQGILALPPPASPAEWDALRAQLAERNRARGRNQILEGLVTQVNDVQGAVYVDLGDRVIRLGRESFGWIRSVRRGTQARPVSPTRPSLMVGAGDRLAVFQNDQGQYVLAAWPAAEAALLAMDVGTREVLAMIGGRDYTQSEFNRALQARRQPGSAFKPIVYAAALNAGLTPATIFPDTALVYGDNWRPANYDRKFRGYMSLRDALTHSINTVTIRVAESIGIEYLQRFARHLGLRSLAGGDLSMAIGTYEIVPAELINAYAVFASGGKLAEPVFITQVTDRDGRVLEEYRPSDVIEQESELLGTPNLRRFRLDQPTPPPLDTAAPAATPSAPYDEERMQEFMRDFNLGRSSTATPTPIPVDQLPFAATTGGRVIVRQVLNPQVAYVITSMMHSVATRGTGARSRTLGRTVAGKTGTTNSYNDAWFIGFSPRVLAGVWVGYDGGSTSLGSGETGGTTALPIWIDFMRVALEGEADLQFAVPPGVVIARIDPATGLLAPPDMADAVEECFVAGTEPTEFAPSRREPSPQDFFEFEGVQ